MRAVRLSEAMRTAVDGADEGVVRYVSMSDMAANSSSRLVRVE
jgi:hypothetical protein